MAVVLELSLSVVVLDVVGRCVESTGRRSI